MTAKQAKKTAGRNFRARHIFVRIPDAFLEVTEDRNVIRDWIHVSLRKEMQSFTKRKHYRDNYDPAKKSLQNREYYSKNRKRVLARQTARYRELKRLGIKRRQVPGTLTKARIRNILSTYSKKGKKAYGNDKR